MNKKIKVVLKLIISGIILFFVLNKVGIDKLLVVQVDWNIFFICFIVGALNNILCSLRWWYLNIKIYNLNTPFDLITKLYFVGAFFNLFLPSSIGGDAVKGHYIYDYTGKKSASLHAIFIDRLLGFYALNLFALFGIIYILFFSTIHVESGQFLLVFILCFLIGTLALPFSGKIPLINKLIKFKLLKEFFSNIDVLVKNKQKLIFSFLLTLIFQLSVIFVSFFMSIALGLNIDFIYFLLIIPINTIITLIPMTFSGVGLREMSFLYLFSLFGFNDVRLVLIPILVFIINILLGIIGGIFYIKGDFIKVN